MGKKVEPVEYNVEAIRSHEILDGQYKFMTKWEGYTEKFNTLEPLSNFGVGHTVLNAYLATIGKTYDDIVAENKKAKSSTVKKDKKAAAAAVDSKEGILKAEKEEKEKRKLKQDKEKEEQRDTKKRKVIPEDSVADPVITVVGVPNNNTQQQQQQPINIPDDKTMLNAIFVPVYTSQLEVTFFDMAKMTIDQAREQAQMHNELVKNCKKKKNVRPKSMAPVDGSVGGVVEATVIVNATPVQ